MNIDALLVMALILLSIKLFGDRNHGLGHYPAKKKSHQMLVNLQKLRGLDTDW